MKPKVPDAFEKGRVRHEWGFFPGRWAGCYLVRGPGKVRLMVVASPAADWPAEFGPGWDHVSVTVRTDDGQSAPRCPTWEEMCWVKDQCFAPGEWVVQFHPAADANISHHPFCLHLWRPVGVEIPRPPEWTV